MRIYEFSLDFLCSNKKKRRNEKISFLSTKCSMWSGLIIFSSSHHVECEKLCSTWIYKQCPVWKFINFIPTNCVDGQYQESVRFFSYILAGRNRKPEKNCNSMTMVKAKVEKNVWSMMMMMIMLMIGLKLISGTFIDTFWAE